MHTCMYVCMYVCMYECMKLLVWKAKSQWALPRRTQLLSIIFQGCPVTIVPKSDETQHWHIIHTVQLGLRDFFPSEKFSLWFLEPPGDKKLNALSGQGWKYVLDQLDQNLGQPQGPVGCLEGASHFFNGAWLWLYYEVGIHSISSV